MKKKATLYIVQGALIAAMYATMTILQNVLIPGSASMTVQFRLAEVLTVLALYKPAAIPGLTVGCVIANISSVTASLGLYDLILGSLATLLAALSMYALRNVRLFKLPVLAALMPALFNGVIIGAEIDFFVLNGGSGFSLNGFLVSGGFVALGELAVLFVLGLPLTRVIEISGLDKKLFTPKLNK